MHSPIVCPGRWEHAFWICSCILELNPACWVTEMAELAHEGKRVRTKGERNTVHVVDGTISCVYVGGGGRGWGRVCVWLCEGGCEGVCVSGCECVEGVRVYVRVWV